MIPPPRLAPEHTPKILTVDIETSPAKTLTWGLWDQNIQPTSGQLVEPSRVICLAAKAYGSKRVQFYSDFHDGHAAMIQAAHDLLSQADILIHFNGSAFDLKHLKREFVLAGMPPPAPSREVDLLKVARSQFKFMSNKLDYLARELGVGRKVKHPGFSLWVDCMAGDAKAWALMKRYNVGDVRLTEELYDRLRPWIPGHPHLGLYSGEPRSCQNCGSTDLTRDGETMTPLTQYARYKCDSCGAWSRQNHRMGNVTMRGVK